MIREEFIKVIQTTGMLTLKELRRLTLNKDQDQITEFELLDYRHFDDQKFASTISEKTEIPFLDISNATISPETIAMLKKGNIRKFRSIPIQHTTNKVVIATYDPSVINHKKEMVNLLRKPVEYVLVTLTEWKALYQQVKESVDELLSTVKQVKGANPDEDQELKAEDIGRDVITFVNRILVEAFVKGVSDIHFEPYEKIFRVRFRQDGNLVIVSKPPKSLMAPIVSRLKIMADLDISEKRKPQDGRIKLQVGGEPIDFRVSSLPTLFGEKVVLRLLDQSNLQLDMTKLGFEEEQLKVFKDAIHRPYGMCLVTGPTGSGKTTTLYSALADINSPDTNISTAEDPCEFNLEGINQVNVRKDIGLTFASSLKAFLRQDPDVIMVGEIRDFEVGEIAVEAALTGHMVLSTLHTNDAPSTVTRLLNMGIEPFLVTAALNVVVAQRLCRKICAHCRVETETSEKVLIAAGFAAETAKKVKTYKGAGCKACGKTGFKGRISIYEVLLMTPRTRELVINNGSSDELKKVAIEEGMKTLRMSALTKVARGLITLEEAVTTSSADDI